MKQYPDVTPAEAAEAMERSWQAFRLYRNTSIAVRAAFLRAIATQIESLGEILIEVAMRETNLPHARLVTEKNRTLYQLNSYADACERGEWLRVRIDTADAGRVPPKPDVRKTMTPLGPVVVFGASNFPFAYSTAGGDTACAFAAGCTVVVKAHPAHPQTSELVAGAIWKAAADCGLPATIFEHVYGAATQVGQALVMHSKTKAVGFTGSFGGGKALFDWAGQRPEPIPVFAEMGSVNPVFLFEGRLSEDAAGIAKMYAASITLSAGQFCTNPGILIAVDSEGLNIFRQVLAAEIRKVAPQTMLHPGIAKAFADKTAAVALEPEVFFIATSQAPPNVNKGAAIIAETTASAFLANPKLHQEIFGPFSLLIVCRSMAEMEAVAAAFEGQLTATVIGNEEELLYNRELIATIKEKCGRLIMNGVPTGVEVCLAMNHGGPFPATTDSRFTAVGADGINRFARPVSYQNFSMALLPPELQDGNPLGIIRTVNNVTAIH